MYLAAMRNRRQDQLGFGVNGKAGSHNPCFECGVITNGLHHVIPVSKGGTKQLPLCPSCHDLVHNEHLVSHKKLLIEGLIRAKGQGAILGAPVKLTKDMVSRICELRGQGKSYRAIALDLGISVGSVSMVLRTKAHSLETP